MSDIPKIIHYCWFGRNPLPESAVKCIDSWRKFFPDYEIKEWNEDNFDVNIIPYTAEAYAARKYAFVSDYARVWILYQYGGIYFDTDVEVVKPMDDIIRRGAYMGIESCSGERIMVNPGLGMACGKAHVIFKKVLEVFEKKHFRALKGDIDIAGIVPITTSILLESGLVSENKCQLIQGISVYPIEYFNPYNYTQNILNVSKNTYSIHWYDASWVSTIVRMRLKITARIRKLLSR